MENNMKDLNEVVQKVKSVEDGVANLIIPILKDSVKDGNQHNKRLFVIIMMLVLALMIVSVTSMVIIYNQNQKYAEFLSQFEFESEIIQDLDASDNSSIFNPSLNNTK